MNAKEFLQATRVPREQIPWNDLYERIDLAGKERDRDFLAEVFAGLEQDPEKHALLSYTIPGMLLDALVRAYAPYELAPIISFLIRFASLQPKFSAVLKESSGYQQGKPLEAVRRAAGLAAQLGAGSALTSLHARHPMAIEFIACCAHEAVLRDVTFSPDEQRALAELIEQHPLSRLPLQRMSLESLVVLPPYLFSTRGMGGVSCPSFTNKIVSEEVTVPNSVKLEVDTQKVASAYLGEGLSNAKVEVARFQLSEAAPIDDLLLESLPLVCTGRSDAQDEDDFSFVDKPPKAVEAFACTPEEAFQIFFSVGYTGRCYQTWSFAAWARLKAWESLQAMCDVPRGASLLRAQEHIKDNRFTFFTCPSSWYDQIMFDIGLAAYDPETKRVTIFAGTDSD